MAGRTTAANRCSIHEDLIQTMIGTLTDIKVQGQAHTDGLARLDEKYRELVNQRVIQNGRLDRVEKKVYYLFLGLAAVGGASLGLPRLAEVLTKAFGG